MRIISGQHKGKRITAPKKLPIRPTTDFAKEALFNILNNRFNFKDLEVLDIFSGSGNISYEFGSRGAGPITSVDENIECVKFIKKTADELDLNITAVKSDVFKYLEKAPIKADVIFADPPYDMDVETLQKIVAFTFDRGLLKEDGELIIEHSKRLDLSATPHFVEIRKYGNSVFSFFS
ncbi:MAG: RsmD family RNA methyltransferase [Gillisia sp.]